MPASNLDFNTVDSLLMLIARPNLQVITTDIEPKTWRASVDQDGRFFPLAKEIKKVHGDHIGETSTLYTYARRSGVRLSRENLTLFRGAFEELRTVMADEALNDNSLGVGPDLL